MTTQQDDFLAQVLETETQAAQIIEKAQEQSRVEQGKMEKELKQKRLEVLMKEKEKAKATLQVRQVEAKQRYEKVLKEGEGEIIQLKKEAVKKEETLLATAAATFLNDII